MMAAPLHERFADGYPACVRALYREYEPVLVTQALAAVGIHYDPAAYPTATVEAASAQARNLLRAEMDRRQKDRMSRNGA